MACYERVVASFTEGADIIAQERESEVDQLLGNEYVIVATKFALLTRRSFTNAKLQKSFAKFQLLILLSYCEVLRLRGVPYSSIDPIIQLVATGRERDRKMLLEGAAWVNDLVVALVKHGWTIQRATELFFLGEDS